MDPLTDKLAEALREILTSAVILDRDYLSLFSDWEDSKSIQGWPKSRWLKAADAADKARSAIREYEAAKDGDDEFGDEIPFLTRNGVF